MLCGLSSLSPRSLVAVATFFPTAAVTFPPCLSKSAAIPPAIHAIHPHTHLALVTTRLIVLTVAIIAQYHTTPAVVEKVTSDKKAARSWLTFLVGLTFGLGLLISGMASPEKVLGCFAFASPGLRNWDPSLALVVVFGILPQMAYYFSHQKQHQPLYAEKFSLPTKTLKDTELTFVLGAAIFGTAWGISGICPGPAILRAVG